MSGSMVLGVLAIALAIISGKRWAIITCTAMFVVVTGLNIYRLSL